MSELDNEAPREGIGAPVRRKEDLRFLTGRGCYTDDLQLPDQLCAAFVRSPYAHAEIRGVDASRALSLPGVIAVFTGEDLLRDGVGELELDFILRNFDGRPMVVPPRRPLASGRVRYAGEPVAIVIATTALQAKDAAEMVEVAYDELPVVVDPVRALDSDSPAVWSDAPGNICCEVRYGDWDGAERAFAGAAHVTSIDLVNNRLVGNPLEPRAAIAAFDPAAGRSTLYCSHQTPFALRTQLCATLRLPEHRLRVVSRDVGGGFGVKGPTYPEEAALVWAAGRLRRPVKWRCDRSEAFLADAHARDHVTKLEMACDGQGRFLAIRVSDIANLGAYVSSFGAGPPVIAQSLLSAGPYRIAAVCGRVRLVFTNTVPTDAYRGAGRPENTYMLERLVDRVARELEISPVELRRKNLIAPQELPWKTPLGRVYDSGDFPKNLELALGAADYRNFEVRRREAKARGRMRGFGISTYIEHSGMGPSDIIMSHGSLFGTYESAQVRLNASGGVIVFTGTHSHGQGLETAFAQIVSDRLGIPLEDVEVRHGDTDELGNGRGTIGSRSLLSGGAAIKVALDKIEAKGKRIAAHLLECALGDIEFRRGRFAIAGTDRAVSIREIAKAAYFPARYPLTELEPGLDEGGYWDPKAVASPSGCHVCEVEIDPDTGQLAIMRFVAVDDFGNIVNPLIVEGQVHGGVAQGLGQAALEHCVYDQESGQLVTGSFVDYCMPRADDLPDFDTLFNGHPCETNPLGVKGCGEAGAIGSPPALANAVADALLELGIRHLDMPFTPEKLWRAISGGPR